MSLTTFRQALATLLSAELEIPFVDGRIEGPIEGRNLGCTFPVRISEGDSAIEQVVTVAVRVFLALPTRASVTEAPDPAQLEDIAERIQQVVQDNQTDLGPWYQRVTEVEFDAGALGVEATVTAWQQNLSVL